MRSVIRRFRRLGIARRNPTNKPPRRVQGETSVSVTVDVPIDAVWQVVSDVTRIGEWSHEGVGASWLKGATSATPGARFRGRNRAGLLRWGRVSEIVSVEPYELVWRTVPTLFFPDSSQWHLALEQLDGATRISQRYQMLHEPKLLFVLYALVVPAHRDRTAALVCDLQRLGAVADKVTSTRSNSATVSPVRQLRRPHAPTS